MRAFFRSLFLAGLLLGNWPGVGQAQVPAEPPFSLTCRRSSRVGSSKEQFCETRDLTLPALAGEPLTIEGSLNGSVTVLGWDGPDVRVRALLQSGAKTVADAQAQVQAIALTTTGNTLRVVPPPELKAEWLVSYEVFVPHRTALVVRAQNGNVRLRDIQARIQFHLTNGDVTLSELGGQVTGETTNGTVRISLAGRQWEGAGLEVGTVNGNVRWSIPADYSTRVELRTVHGNISSQWPSVSSGGGREVNATLGQGGALLKASTVNGNLYVSQDGQPDRPATGASVPATRRLKAALEAGTSTPDSLLTRARRLGYVPGQVVALAALAAQPGTPPARQATLLQEAASLAAQLRDSPDAGWALSQVSQLQGQASRQSPALAGAYGSLMQALGEAVGASAAARVPPVPPTPELSLPTAAAQQRLRSLAALAEARLPTTLPGLGKRGALAYSLPSFSDKWLDTLLARPGSSPQVVRQLAARRQQRDKSQALSTAFAKEGDYAKAYQYFLRYTAYKDSLTAEATANRLATLEYRQNLLQKEAQIQRLTKEQLLRRQAARRQQQSVVTLAICVAVLGLVAFVLSGSNRARRRANAALSEQKEALQQTLADLRTAQTQLVQSEKMASLGELTAGIAHEIQNPLNFVNNFSEVSTELLDELLAERRQPAPDPELEAELLADVRQNLTKIGQHGQRAAAIVRGMLEHARSSPGQRQPTDLNALAEEYGKLAYHAARAKNKAFEARLTWQLAPDLPAVPAVAQDLGRVLLNVFTNALYAVQQKSQVAGATYHPEVLVRTCRTGSQVQLQIRDNGAGIPEAIRQKVFQPFFTTKPTGEGTGLGLSLSYDIVTKGHGGTFALDSAEGEFTELTLTLPVAG